MSTEGFVSSEVFRMAMEHIDRRFDDLSKMVDANTRKVAELEREVDKLAAATESAKADGVSRWGASLAKFFAGVGAAVSVIGAFTNWFHKGP